MFGSGARSFREFSYPVPGPFHFSLCLMPGGQLDPEGFLIDQGTLALRFLLCPRGLRVSLSPCHKPGDHSAVMNGEEAGGV